ncbi:MAG: septum formation initiator family protein [Acidobacteria bacterium]|nr:septum formation initiator family protein [Acidobacteriota bacterium]
MKQKPSAAPSSAKGSRLGRRTLHYVLLLIGTVLIVDALVGEKGLLAMLQARAQHAALEQSLADVRDDNARLREEARRLREDPDAIEDLARSQLGLIRPGEKLFIVKDVAPRDLR